VKEGEFLLAVNGVPVDTSKDPWAAFQYRADETVLLTIGETPSPKAKTREVLVRTMSNDGNLRYRAWIERNRKYVEEKSGGKVGYIYVPNTGVDGQSDLFRQFFGQRHLPGLIIDERWNGGGQIPTRFIELLNRPVVSYWARRHGQDWIWPPDSAPGAKCMLVNGLAGSGGDMFPWLFKLNKLGKVIGTRTWGGLVGISGNPGLIDGGSITVPTFGIYENDGSWAVEGHGVDPDIEVIDDPSKMVDGGDPQLDAGIQQMLSEISERPFVRAKRPKSPDRKGMGITDEDK
jgi:tricorn protease